MHWIGAMLKVKQLIKWIKRIFCKHDFREYAGCDLEMQKDGHWRTVHKWRCRKCGKLQKRVKQGGSS